MRNYFKSSVWLGDDLEATAGDDSVSKRRVSQSFAFFDDSDKASIEEAWSKAVHDQASMSVRTGKRARVSVCRKVARAGDWDSASIVGEAA